MKNLRKVANDEKIPVIYWYSNTKELKQQNRAIIDINICKIKDVFVHIFVHFLCTFCALSS